MHPWFLLQVALNVTRPFKIFKMYLHCLDQVKVSERALSAQDELSQALSESEKNAGLLAEYHELYELQRRRLEGVTLKISSEKELWQQTAYDLALKVASEYSLFTVRQLQLGEKTWNQLATHFIVLLTQDDTQQLSGIEQLVSLYRGVSRSPPDFWIPLPLLFVNLGNCFQFQKARNTVVIFT